MFAHAVRYLRDGRGSSAVEFALIIPAFLALTLGTIHIGFILYAASTLHSAVEVGARCASVRSASDCSTLAKTQTYALARYEGPAIGATFVATVDLTCGKRVTGTGSYGLNAGLFGATIPLEATACYP